MRKTIVSSTYAHRPGAWRMAFYLCLGAVSTWIVMRNHGVYPAVFADEWYYSRMSRLAPLAEALVPSYLYLWIFSASNACGTGFLECVRLGNLAFYLAALPFFHGIARRYTSRGYAMLLTVLAAAAPLNVYTMYFMPEATYWFAFCLLSWIMLTRDSWSTLGTALAGGLVLGLMSLIKVHALFLVPALCLYLVYASWLAGGTWKRCLARGAAAALAAAALTVAVKFGLGWLLAGDAGLSLLGPFYQGNVSSGSTAMRMALLYPILVSALGHLMALAVLFGVPLAVLLHGMVTGVLRRDAAPAGRLQVYTLLMLGAAAGMAVFYTATLADRGAADGVLLYVKPAIVGNENADLLNYRKLHPDYPHESIADQWFDEAQFESYRALGDHIVDCALREAARATVGAHGEQDIEALCAQLLQRHGPAARGRAAE